MTNWTCRDGCARVAAAYLSHYDDSDENSDNVDVTWTERVRQCECFKAIAGGGYGGFHHAPMTYAAKHGHVQCLKELHGLAAEWHSDLAIVALKADQLGCLQYVIEHMGNVYWSVADTRDIDAPRCRQYVDRYFANHPKAASRKLPLVGRVCCVRRVGY